MTPFFFYSLITAALQCAASVVNAHFFALLRLGPDRVCRCCGDLLSTACDTRQLSVSCPQVLTANPAAKARLSRIQLDCVYDIEFLWGLTL